MELNANPSNEMDHVSNSVLKNMYNYLLSFVKSNNTNTNLVANSTTSTYLNDNLTESSNFSGNSYNLKRRTFEFLDGHDDEEEVFDEVE
jgi:hypothetical protein